MDKPKIAVIGLKGLPAFGGAASVGENIIEQLKDKYNFTVYFTSSHTTSETKNLNGFNKVIFHALPLKKINTLYYYLISSLHAIIRGNYDLIHLHHRDAAFIIPLLKIKFKTILTTHGIFEITDKWRKYHLYFKIQEALFVKKADIVTCVSNKGKNEIKRRLNIEAYKIPNGISIIPITSIKHIAKKKYIFFGAGRIIEIKGCHLLFEALNIIDYRNSIFIAGELSHNGDYSKRLKTTGKKLNLNYLGLIKNKNLLLKYMSECRLFVFPSLMEAMSMMLLEAASVKAPIICSDIIPNKDIFSDGEVLFFKSNDSYDLAEKIKYALANDKVMSEYAERAYNKVNSLYRSDIMAKKYAEIFDKLICLNGTKN